MYGGIDNVEADGSQRVLRRGLLVTGAAYAQNSATLTLRSGEKVSGDLVDLGGVGYTVRVNGNERQIPQNDVAVIDFTGGSMSDADWAKFTGDVAGRAPQRPDHRRLAV